MTAAKDLERLIREQDYTDALALWREVASVLPFPYG